MMDHLFISTRAVRSVLAARKGAHSVCLYRVPLGTSVFAQLRSSPTSSLSSSPHEFGHSTTNPYR
jgi:hypothetical protein